MKFNTQGGPCYKTIASDYIKIDLWKCKPYKWIPLNAHGSLVCEQTNHHSTRSIRSDVEPTILKGRVATLGISNSIRISRLYLIFSAEPSCLL